MLTAEAHRHQRVSNAIQPVDSFCAFPSEELELDAPNRAKLPPPPSPTSHTHHPTHIHTHTHLHAWVETEAGGALSSLADVSLVTAAISGGGGTWAVTL